VNGKAGFGERRVVAPTSREPEHLVAQRFYIDSLREQDPHGAAVGSEDA
jgi:hypothetical protein